MVAFGCNSLLVRPPALLAPSPFLTYRRQTGEKRDQAAKAFLLMEGQVREKCVPLLVSQSVEGLLPGKLLLNLALIFDKQNRDGLYGTAFIPFFMERVVRVGIAG